MSTSDFSGKRVLVTGAASGIGLATAQQFARQGATLALADLNEDALNAALDSLEADGSATTHRAYVTDVSKEDQVENTLAAVARDLGPLHCATNCAGISDPPGELASMPLAQWQHMIDVNQTSVFLCLKHEIRHMLERDAAARQGCAIVNVSSGAGLVPAPGQPHYTAAKHAVIGLTRYAAQEQVKNGIRVNAVCPGLIDTPMAAANVPQRVLDNVSTILPTGRMGTADEMAAVIIWLCSTQAGWVNGQSIVADGGMLFH